MKINFNPDEELPLRKTLELHSIIIAKFVLHEGAHTA